MPQITKNTKLSELLNDPKTVEILAKYNIPCLGCPFAQFEMDKLKIGEICQIYKVDLDKLLKELNKIYTK